MVARNRLANWLSAALCIGGCNGGLQSAAPPGGDGSGGQGTGTTPRGEGFIGTWDYVASSNGDTSAGVIEVSPSMFHMTLNDEEDFQYWDQSGVTRALYRSRYSGDRWDNTDLSVARTPAPFDLGALALSPGGTSRFSDRETSMQLDVAAGVVTVRFFDERGQVEDQYIAERLQTGTSSFGDLGGTWQVHEPGDTSRSCTFTFGVNTFAADCRTVPALEGTVNLTFNGDAASGTVAPNGEVSAFRR